MNISSFDEFIKYSEKIAEVNLNRKNWAQKKNYCLNKDSSI